MTGEKRGEEISVDGRQGSGNKERKRGEERRKAKEMTKKRKLRGEERKG